jgi:membrane associated rhomboid family serine protease
MGIFDDLKMQYRLGGVAEKLIFWNIGCFVVPFVLMGILSLLTIQFDFIHWFSLSSNPADLLWKPWSIVTYAFFHAGFFHILFNLLWFHFASRLFQTFFTQKQLLGVYILGAILGGVFFILSFMVFPRFSGLQVPMVGASAAVNAVLIAIAVYSPYMPIRLFFLGNVKLWHIAVTFFILDLIRLSGANAGGHLSHIGGALFGYIFIKQLQNGNDLTQKFSEFVDWILQFFQSKKEKPFRKVHRNEKPMRQSNEGQITQQQIDAILDKISQSGYDSLTKQEKELLFKAGK